MHDPNLNVFNDIKADKDLIDKTTQRVLNSPVKNKYNYKKIIALAASFLIVIGALSIYSLNPNIFSGEVSPGDKTPNNSTLPPTDTADSGLEIPAIELPKNTNGAAMDMMGLIVYNGRIYTQTFTDIDAQSGLNLLGDKLGTTKGNIDEWSKQDEYTIEFASTIGQEDVYTVKGYDKDFRIMTYTQYDDGNYAQFYECLNGITIQNGEDVFGKLKIAGNIIDARYRSYSDWNNGVENYRPISDMVLFNNFIEELNHTKPYSYESLIETIEDSRNDEEYRSIAIELKDGSIVNLVLLKDGHIRYGYTDVYFLMDNEIFQKLWEQLKI